MAKEKESQGQGKGSGGTSVAPTDDAPKNGNAVSAYDYGDNAGEGFEGTTQDDLSIPFLNILQRGSPEVDEGTLEGAEEGMILNSVTKELTKAMGKDDPGLVIVPCLKETGYVEWIHRDNGGGFVGKHEAKSEIVLEAIKRNDGSKYGGLTTPGEKGADNQLVETVEIYCLILDNEGKSVEGFAVLTLTSTKLKAAKDWYTAMFSIKGKPPIYANRARLKTFKDKNKKGTFANIVISPLKGTWKDSLIDPETGEDIIRNAKEFRTMVLSGAAKANYEEQGSQGGEGDGKEEGEVF